MCKYILSIDYSRHVEYNYRKELCSYMLKYHLQFQM